MPVVSASKKLALGKLNKLPAGLLTKNLVFHQTAVERLESILTRGVVSHELVLRAARAKGKNISLGVMSGYYPQRIYLDPNLISVFDPWFSFRLGLRKKTAPNFTDQLPLITEFFDHRIKELFKKEDVDRILSSRNLFEWYLTGELSQEELKKFKATLNIVNRKRGAIYDHLRKKTAWVYSALGLPVSNPEKFVSEWLKKFVAPHPVVLIDPNVKRLDLFGITFLENFVSTRIRPNQILGVMIPQHPGVTEKARGETIKICKKLGVPAYEANGKLIWPRIRF